MKESDLQIMVADYLRMRYPKVLFHSDFGSGIKLTMGQAAKQKRQNGGRRGWPDMIIAEQGRINFEEGIEVTTPALFLELKKEGTRIFKKNGDYASEHIKEQAEILAELRERGFRAAFACGFEQAKAIIDDYLWGYDGR